MTRLSPLDYARHDIPVLPIFEIVKNADGKLVCSCGRKPGADCSPGKHPVSDLAPHGLSDATTDVAVIKGWMAKRPHSNWAMPTGAASGYNVLDVDPKHDGLSSIKDLTGSETPGPDWDTDLIQKTGNGGYHLLFPHSGKPIKNRVGFRPGLDIRGDGGYVVVAPSNHISGGVYEWLNGNPWANSNGGGPSSAARVQWLVDALAEHDTAPVIPDVIPEGQRDNTMTSMAGTMRRRRFPPEAILAALRVVNRDMVRPPLDDHDLRRIVNSSKSWAPAAEATESSWLPKDIKAWLAGDRSPLEPTYLIRSDGQPLLYRGRTHSFIGEPENGKSWLAQIAAAERLQAGEPVFCMDFESELDDVGGHLLALGVSNDQLAAGFHYIRPDVRMNKAAIADLVAMVSDWAPELTWFDGVERGLAMWGKDSNLNKDVIAWEEMLVRPLAKATPGATVVIDHVTKNAATRGPYATGAGAKLAGIDGASFSVELVPGANNYFGKGKVGLARILLQKDSRGGGSLRGKQGAGKVIAFMKLTSSEDGEQVTYALQPPAPETPGTSGAVRFVPTAYMEKVSKQLEDSAQPLNQTEVVDLVGGKAHYVRVALAELVKDGYVTFSEGARGAHLHRSIKQYRDPALQPPADYKTGGPI